MFEESPISGLRLTETALGPVETDADSHQPLMSDDESEVYTRQHPSVQEPGERTTSSQAISFWRAFFLPGVLPVSPDLYHKPELRSLNFTCCALAAVFPGLRLSEAGQLLLFLLASVLPEQQLRLERGRGRPPVHLVRRRRDLR